MRILILLSGLVIVYGFSAHAEVISLPENCFIKQINPCLVKANTETFLMTTQSNLQIHLGENSILKILSFESPYEIEILQGRAVIQSKNKNNIAFKLNEIQFDSNKVLAQYLEKKISVFDAKTFILSDYDPGAGQNQETVILKSDFPSKLDMVVYVSKFYKSKSDLVSFLKNIESDWENEFKSQTAKQTKVLQRSIASVEKEETFEKQQKERDALELKKVRNLFFYRTFYR